MQIVIQKNYKSLSEYTAKIIASCVRNKPTATLCFASGESPIGTYHALVEMVEKEGLDFSHCTFIGLDEWVGFDKEDEGSCGYFLFRDFFSKLSIPANQIHFFDAKSNDLQAECTKIDDIIFKNGGLDLLLIGIGMNGHIALNEPQTSFENYCHVVELAEITKQVGQKYFSKSTPLSQGITLGLKHLQEAKSVILIANDLKKASIIQQALEGEINENMPASILQKHANSFVILDEEAASFLKK